MKLFTQYLAVVGIALVFSQTTSATEQRWVSDSLSTYVRSGPSDGHRIIGSLVSGAQVTRLSEQGEYSQVLTERDKKVWIATRDLQSVAGQAERLPALEAQVGQLNAQLADIEQSWQTRLTGLQETLEARKALIAELEARNRELSAQLTDEQSALREAKALLGQENQQALMTYMVYGASIAGVGVLGGLLLPALTRVRGRKRQSEWV